MREDAAVVSEIAAGRIALFTPRLRVALVSVALALRRERQSGLSGPTTGPSPAFARHPALCSSDFPLPLLGAAVARRYQVLPNLGVVYIIVNVVPVEAKASGFCLEARQQGLEPQPSHPKCDVLPLNYCRTFAERSCHRMSASGCYSSDIATAGSHLARLQLYPNRACASIFSWREVTQISKSLRTEAAF